MGAGTRIRRRRRVRMSRVCIRRRARLGGAPRLRIRRLRRRGGGRRGLGGWLPGWCLRCCEAAAAGNGFGFRIVWILEFIFVVFPFLGDPFWFGEVVFEFLYAGY